MPAECPESGLSNNVFRRFLCKVRESFCRTIQHRHFRGLESTLRLILNRRIPLSLTVSFISVAFQAGSATLTHCRPELARLGARQMWRQTLMTDTSLPETAGGSMENLKSATISASFENLLKHDGPAGLVTFL